MGSSLTPNKIMPCFELEIDSRLHTAVHLFDSSYCALKYYILWARSLHFKSQRICDKKLFLYQ